MDSEISRKAEVLSARLALIREVVATASLDWSANHMAPIPAIDAETKSLAADLQRLARRSQAATPWLDLFCEDSDAFEALPFQKGDMSDPQLADLIRELETLRTQAPS
jgi:hypothetical protein